jgi:hypothetical protein
VVRNVEHDPLCHPRREEVADCICRELRTARLQGPVKENKHAPLCWCPLCLQASDDIHGVPA